MILSPLYKRLMQITGELTKSCGFPEELCKVTLELAINVNNFSVFG